MPHITPHMVNVYAWMAFALTWLVGMFFAARTKFSEGFGRLHYLPFEVAGFFLLLHGRDYAVFHGRFYEILPLEAAGAVLSVAGLVFAVWARLHLGKYWSGRITLKEGHKIIRTGPYALVRHPIYTGLLAAALGSAGASATLDAYIGLLLLIGTYLFKLRREEKILTAAFGDQYVQYKADVACLIPFLVPTKAIQSEAFQKAALKSERYRIYAMLVFIGGFILINLGRGIFAEHTAANTKRFYVYITFWLICATYELVFLWLTVATQRAGRQVRPWIWSVNTFLECLLPTIAILGQTSTDKSYLGPYLALSSGSLILYCFCIILASLRLSPALCIFAGSVSALGYTGMIVFTYTLAADNPKRNIYPLETFVMNGILIFGAGLIAAAVASQIRRHVIAALAEAETRRKLDRIEQDLQTARAIQMGLLPKSAPHIPGYDIAGWSQPADQTGGDYYDWLELPPANGRGPTLLFTIADATGHGIGPALLVAACRAYFRAVASHNDPLESITQQVDTLLSADCPDGRFITAAVALLDPAIHSLSLYSAGHAPLYFYKAATDSIETFDADQPPLGIRIPADPSTARTLPLAPGDALILITDGFFECSNPAGDLLGIERLAEHIRTRANLPSQNLIHDLHQEVIRFTAGTAQADDITAVIIKRNR